MWSQASHIVFAITAPRYRCAQVRQWANRLALFAPRYHPRRDYFVPLPFGSAFLCAHSASSACEASSSADIP